MKNINNMDNIIYWMLTVINIVSAITVLVLTNRKEHKPEPDILNRWINAVEKCFLNIASCMQIIIGLIGIAIKFFTIPQLYINVNIYIAAMIIFIFCDIGAFVEYFDKK